MKKHILVKNKKEIFKRNQQIQIKSNDAWKWFDAFQACEYDKQTNILAVNYVAYAITKTRQWLNFPAVPYIEAFTDKENLEMQQKLQKYLCAQQLKILHKNKDVIYLANNEFGASGESTNLSEAVEDFIANASNIFINKNQALPRDYKDNNEIYFMNCDNLEIQLPKKYVDKIWDEVAEKVEVGLEKNRKEIAEDEANEEDVRNEYLSNLI